MGLVLAYLVPAIFLFVTLVLWIVAGALYAMVQRKNGKARRVTGQVTGHHEYSGRGGQAMYRAEFSTDVDGQTVTGRSQVATSWQSPTLGTRVDLYYNPEARDDEPVLREAGYLQYLAPAILFSVGLSLALGAVIMAVFVHLQIAKHEAGMQRTAKPVPSAEHPQPAPDHR